MALPLVPGPGLVFMRLGCSLPDCAWQRKSRRRMLGGPSEKTY